MDEAVGREVDFAGQEIPCDDRRPPVGSIGLLKADTLRHPLSDGSDLEELASKLYTEPS